MGNVCGGSDGGGDSNTKVINKQLRKEKKAQSTNVELLLAGAGESGKSTLFKQMKLLYSKKKSFDSEDISGCKTNVFRNVINDLRVLCKAVDDAKQWENIDGEMESAIQAIAIVRLGRTAANEKGDQATFSNIADRMMKIWTDDRIKDVWLKRGELKLQVQDSLEYFMDPGNFNRLKDKSYIPTADDILRTRIKTTGVTFKSFNFFNTTLKVIDVGGQRSERGKWMDSFDLVNAIIYVAAVSEYDQVLYEDNTVNRQQESLEFFEKIVNRLPWVERNTAVILFLNKTDLLQKKLKVIDFKVAAGNGSRFPEFQMIEGKSLYDSVLLYYEGVYTTVFKLARGEAAEIKVHYTNSTDGALMSTVMDDCKDIILTGNLVNSGWV